MLVKTPRPNFTAYDRMVEQRQKKIKGAALRVKAAYDKKHGIKSPTPRHEREK